VCIFVVFSAHSILFLVLHPRHKLSYFKTARWEADWIETAESLVCDEFNRSYLSVDNGLDGHLASVEERSPINDKQVYFFSFILCPH
jgi:hypothetical protein